MYSSATACSAESRLLPQDRELERFRRDLEQLQRRLDDLESQYAPCGSSDENADAIGRPGSPTYAAEQLQPASLLHSEASDPDDDPGDALRQCMQRLLRTAGTLPERAIEPPPDELAGKSNLDLTPAAQSSDPLGTLTAPHSSRVGDLGDAPSAESAVEPQPARPPRPAPAPDLHAMRELATVAARTVHIQLESKRHAKLAIDKLLVALVCLPCGLLLLYWSFRHHLSIAYLAATIALFVTAVWGAQSFRYLAMTALAHFRLLRLWR